jgi:hypothetical protein
MTHHVFTSAGGKEGVKFEGERGRERGGKEIETKQKALFGKNPVYKNLFTLY